MKITRMFAAIALASTTAAPGFSAPVGQEAAVTVPPATLLSYAGSYKTDRGSDAIVTLGLDGSLIIQLNSPPLLLRPVSQTEFAVDEKRARIIFNSADGKVSGFTLRQGPRELQATRID